jgi:hypothetical protein
MMMVNLRDPNSDYDEEDNNMISTGEMMVSPDSIFSSDTVDTS